MTILQHKCWWCERYDNTHAKVLVLGKERYECKNVAACNERVTSAHVGTLPA